MGDMADMTLDMCAQHEAEWDNYVAGDMSDYEAYEAGIIDSSGYADSAQLDRVVARNPIPTRENLDNQLSHAVKDLTIAGHLHSQSRPPQYKDKARIEVKPPTCNCCGHKMRPRRGKYGNFFYCGNQCEGQKCVSERSLRK